MKWFRKMNTLPQEEQQLILHNGRDMRRFYTLSTEERQNVLDRISLSNSPEELELGLATKRKTHE
ncbi:MAG: hypothetical protein HFE61_08090 [Anaerotignum sp.]|jgi:hypothetical protein|nr:hypothetical protein [Anaerotignum sp.]MCI8868083.1 hypothetical protein [Anaerotignum sp.]